MRDDERQARFRKAFWRAFSEADSIRLRQWERSSVTLPQLRVLYHLRRRPHSTTGELARRLGITVSTTSGLVIKLVDRGLVARGSLADDRRQAPLSLTDEGAALLGELSEEGRAFLARVADRLGDDLDTVTAALERLAEAGLLADEAERADEAPPRCKPSRRPPRDAPAPAGDTTARGGSST
ncbi:MAG: MarR family transcriptional regulator [Chloroflexi bacterium]|nr:MarR family transcriptional regulator [Chloroflexota bacterium]